MQVENPEEIENSGIGKGLKIFLYILLFFTIVGISLYFIGYERIDKFFNPAPQQQTITSTEKPEDVKTETEIKKPTPDPEANKIFKDIICNDLPENRRIPVWFEAKPEAKLNTFIACSDKDKQDGLIGVFNLNENAAMLFVFENPDLYKFWMKDTSIYISVAFINEQNEIIEIIDPEPLSEERFGPETQKTKYVLEATKGWFEANNLKVGDKIVLKK